MLRFCALLFFCFLAACTRPHVVGFSKPIAEAQLQQVFIATQRSEGPEFDMFGMARVAKMSFAKVLVSIPPIHELGKLERAHGVADPSRHFAAIKAEKLSNAKALATALAQSKRSSAEPLLLFVHGYNNTLEDAAFRLAQIQQDFELENPALLFSWPSAGDPLGYAYDRDSVLFARSDLAELVTTLQANGERRIMIVAHSMGGYLVMEALRDLALQGNTRQIRNIESVVLMSPDIDPDVFRRQARQIGKLPDPFVIMTSRKDRVLNLSSLLAGRKERLGRISSAEEVKGLGVTVLDFSLFEPGEAMGHMVPVSSPEAITFLRRLADGLTLANGAFSHYVLLGEERRGPLGLSN